MEKATITKEVDYIQLCVWEGILLKQEEVGDFESWFLTELGVRVKYLESIKTKPDLNKYGEIIPLTGGRIDVFFYINSEDIGKFAVKRLNLGIRWWEDVLGNGNGKYYDELILEKYPKRW